MMPYSDYNLINIKTFCTRNSIGRTSAYAEIKSGRLYPTKAGRRTLISVDEERRWTMANTADSEKRPVISATAK